jgi:RNA-directed DNA polymerase
VAKHTLDRLQAFVWWRIVNMTMKRYRLTWTALRRRLKGPQGWRPIVLDGVALFDISTVTVTRYRWRGTRIPIPWEARGIETAA